MFTTLTCFITLLAKPEEVESPDDYFQSTRGAITAVRDIKPVAGKL